MSAKNLGLIGGLIILIATAGGFFWLWTVSAKNVTTSPVAENFIPIEIESIKKDAGDLVVNLENNAQIPIPVPVEKMGQEKPFQ